MRSSNNILIQISDVENIMEETKSFWNKSNSSRFEEKKAREANDASSCKIALIDLL